MLGDMPDSSTLGATPAFSKNSKGSTHMNTDTHAHTRIFSLEDQTQKLGKKIWTLTLDLPGEKVNILSQKTLEEFRTLLPRLKQMGESNQIDALVMLSGKPDNFIAGADIKMIQSAKNEEDATRLSSEGQALVNEWEDLPFPRVMGINGTCLGGGCELSLASTAIAMSTSRKAKIGLPETMLGFVPGMGGCVRLPTKIGIASALDMILAGKQLDGKRAHKTGLADALIAEENFNESVQWWTVKNLDALKKGTRLAREPKLGGMGGKMGAALEGTFIGRRVIFNKAREGVMKKTRGKYPALLEAIDVIREVGTGYQVRFRGAKREKAMSREAKGFGKCASTDVSKNLIRIFFMTESLKKANGVPTQPDLRGRSVHTGGVLGAGVMGGGIAQLFADRGFTIRMKDLNNQGLEMGLKAASKIFKKKLKQRRINQREYLQKMNLIAPTTSYDGFESCELIVEAVIEKMDIKKKVLQELEGHIRENCVVASNTSSLSISEMQSVMKRPERFAGMHFFNPVHRMPLVEVIRGEKSSDEAVATVFGLSKKLGKMPIVVKDAPGFLVNRLLMPYLNESAYLVTEGMPIQELDKLFLDFGMPMGPMELIDEVGVDVGDKVAKILHEAFGARMVPCPMNEKVVAANRLGKKNGKGIYRYEGSSDRLKKVFDPEIYQVAGITPKSGAVPPEEVIERGIYCMINEASRCLDEGVVETPSDVDLGMIMGTGFPPFRGGLLRYADSVGAKAIVEALKKHEKRFGARFEPAPRLLKMAETGAGFYSEPVK